MSRFFSLALVVLLAVSCTRADASKPLDLKFTAVDGRQVDFTQLRGKIVIVDFWATWCAPCRIIGPDLLGLYKKYHDQGLEVVGVSDDTDKKALLDYLKTEGVPWPVYFDDTGDEKLVQSLGIDSYPTIWLVGRDGRVIDADFRNYWAEMGGVPLKTAPETLQKIDAVIEKQLQAK